MTPKTDNYRIRFTGTAEIKEIKIINKIC